VHTVQFLITDVILYIVIFPLNFNRHNNSPRKLKLLQKVRRGTRSGQKLVDDLERLFFSYCENREKWVITKHLQYIQFFFWYIWKFINLSASSVMIEQKAKQ